ncbi:hypothetical protein O3M35_008503 [Rhynocoris fuscipes]|uniref:Mos1 transposase HTH domain-containing protein n=1 Tax=Rhynocoris fuscipes TaxID=488301 RepID=A0AAW1DDI0_9HEMI
MIDVTIEQLIFVEFYMKLGITATETYNLLKQVYGNECLSRTLVFVWFKRFQNGRDNVEDDSRPYCTSTSKPNKNIKKLGNLVRSDRRLRAIAESIN